jgi:hypothetical protein
MALRLIAPPTVEPVPLSDLKAFLRVDDGDTSNDATISALALSAREWAEVYTRRRFVTQTWQLSMDYFPGQIDQRLTGQTFSSPFVSGANALLVGIRFGILLPFPPVQSISSFIYQNENGQISSMIQGPVTIAAVSNINAQPLQLTTSTPHNLQTGSAVTLAGNSSLLSFLNGQAFQNVTVLDATHFLLNGTVGDGTTSISGGGTATGYNYVQDLLSQPARLTPVFGQFWPIARVVTNAVQIQFICGYGDDDTTVPEGIKTAIKLLVNYWYENRIPDQSGIPMAVKASLGPYRDLRL